MGACAMRGGFFPPKFWALLESVRETTPPYTFVITRSAMPGSQQAWALARSILRCLQTST